jgi:GT2 family glycosyltransferase
MSAASPSVFAAVLHYGVNPDGSARTLLRDTLDSLLKMTYPRLTLAVVDNGSTDGSQELVRTEYGRVRLIENGANLGVGEGYNVGLREGVRAGADWIFLLNNDIVADPGLLSRMVDAALADPRVGILGPKTYFFSAPDTFWYAGGRVNLFTGVISHRGIREVDRGQYNRVEDTGYVNGCAMLISRSVVDAVGYMDPAFHPAYGEDADYSLRALRAGFRLLYVPEAKLWHRVSASSGGGATPLKTRLKVEHNFLLLRRYARWYHGLTIPWCVGGATIVFVVGELLQGNVGIVAALFKGFFSILRKAR